SEIGEAGLQVERHRIVDRVADALLVEMPLQRVALRRAYDELVVDVKTIGGFRGQRDRAVEAGGAKELAVPRRVRAAARGPPREVRRLHAKDGGLQRVHPEVRADEMVVVLRIHSVRAQQARAPREAIVVGRDEAGVAEGAEILAREKGEAAERADAAGRTRSVRRADRLRGILDDWDAGALRRLHDL